MRSLLPFPRNQRTDFRRSGNPRISNPQINLGAAGSGPDIQEDDFENNTILRANLPGSDTIASVVPVSPAALIYSRI